MALLPMPSFAFVGCASTLLLQGLAHTPSPAAHAFFIARTLVQLWSSKECLLMTSSFELARSLALCDGVQAMHTVCYSTRLCSLRLCRFMHATCACTQPSALSVLQKKCYRIYAL